MDFDFRFNYPLDGRVIPLFDEVATLSRDKYNGLIATASRPLMRDIDWWCENTSSRNTYASPLFHYVCSIELLKEILCKESFSIDKIIVDSKSLFNVIEDLIQKSGNESIEIVYKKELSKTIKDLLKFLYYEWFFFIRLCRKIISMMLPGSKSYLDSENPLTLVDTFITSSYIEEDRWYGSFWENIDKKIQKEIFFVPTVVDEGLIKFYKILKGIRFSQKNYILKEDFLYLSDFIEAYKHKRRVKKINIGKSFLEGVDLTELIKECLLLNRDVHSTMESFLTYKFIKNLSLKNVKVRLSIDWFEGHSVDKMWNLAMYNYFPSTKRIAYETFRSFPYYLSTYPIPIERESHTIPDIFAVQGPACVEGIKEFLPDLEVISVPAFKNQHVWNDQNTIIKNTNIILVAFPISLHTSVDMLESLIENSKKNNSLKASYILKPHPVNSIKDIESKLTVDLPSCFKFSSKESFPVLLSESSILITEASSVCLESFAVGKPVIIIQSSSGLTYDPVPSDIPSELFKKCNTSEDISAALNSFLMLNKEQLTKNMHSGKQIRNNYFERVTEEGINRFLDINK